MNKFIFICLISAAIHADTAKLATPSALQLSQEIDALWQATRAIRAMDTHWQLAKEVDNIAGVGALSGRTKDLADFVKKSGVEAIRSHLNRRIAAHQQTSTELEKQLRAITTMWQSAQTAAIDYSNKLQNNAGALKILDGAKEHVTVEPKIVALVQQLRTDGASLFRTFTATIDQLANFTAQLYTAQANSLQLYWQAISNATTPEKADDPVVQKAKQRLRDELQQLQRLIPGKKENFAKMRQILERVPQKPDVGFDAPTLVKKLEPAIEKIQATISVVYVCVASGACPVAQTSTISPEDVLDDLVKYLQESIVPKFQALQAQTTMLSQAKLPVPPPYRLDKANQDLARVQTLCKQFHGRIQTFIDAINQFITAARAIKKLDQKALNQLRQAFERAHRTLEQGSTWTKSNEYGQLLLRLFEIATPLNLPYQAITEKRPALTFGLINNGRLFKLSDMTELSQGTKDAFISALDALGDVAKLLANQPAAGTAPTRPTTQIVTPASAK